MSVFASWLAEQLDAPKILSVTGPGGIGKTTLLRGFVRHAEERGRHAMLVDGRVVDPSPKGLATALGARSYEEAIASLSNAAQLLLLDSFEDLRPLTHFLLEEFFPALASDVPVVIASREDVTMGWRPWRELVRVLPVGGLSRGAARELLSRRGVADPAEVERVVPVTKGHPLLLSMAADILVQGGARPLSEVPEWPLAVHNLVEDLLGYVDEPGLRHLLEAASLLRQFDESTLAEMSPGEDITGAFSRLCSLSIVRPGDRGLMLHDEVRSMIREDLRWRHPERYQELRRRALHRYRRLRQHAGNTEDATWEFTEAMYLSEDPFVHFGIFNSENPSELWTEPVRVTDRQRLLDMQGAFTRGLSGRSERPTPEELDPELLERLVDLPEARIRVAWSVTGDAVGYGIALPIVPRVLDALPSEGAIARLAARALELAPDGDLGLTEGAGDTWFLGTTVSVPDENPAVTNALAQEILRIFAEPGMFLACTGDPAYKSVLGACGFERLAFELPEGAFPDLDGFVLDTRVIGPEALLDYITMGRPLPRVPSWGSLAPEIEAALENWDDAVRLAASPLADLARVLLRSPEMDRASAIRELVTQTLRSARESSPDDDLAFRALELGYLEGPAKLEVAARRLSVSRPTFYRMRKKAIRTIVNHLVASARSGGSADPPLPVPERLQPG